MGALAILLLAAALGGAAWWFLRPASARMPAPVILISVDTLRADHLPVYGYTRVRTPAIDRLAADGVVFDHAYAHSPQTLPSHAAILTGELPFENGVRDNVGFTLPADRPTLAQALHGRGFATGGVVSAFVLRKETGIARGFDFFDGELPASAPDAPMGQVQRDGTDSLASAERWLAQQQTSRFFLFFHIYEPHKPYTPPARFSEYAPYDGEIAYSDEIVGKLLQSLRDRGIYDSALIVFLSDHGEGLGDHGEQEHGLFLYDETIRVPLIVKLPGQANAGRRVEEPVQHIDLVPTILDMAGMPRPKELRGRSLRPVLESASARLPEPGFYSEAFYSRYHFGWSELTALTDARYRFIKAPRPELYDLREDAKELRNLVADRPQTAAAMRGGLQRLMAGATTVASPGQVSREDLERLQALGYVGTQPADASTPGESLPDPKDKAAILEAYRRSMELAAERKYDESIDLLRQVLADSPTMKDAWVAMGVELTRAGRHEEALAAFKRLVELDPSDANSFVSAGGSLLALNRPDEARGNAEMALRKAPQNDSRARTSACEILLRAAMAKKDYAAARRAGQLAEQAEPRFPLASYAEGLVLHDQKMFAEALPRFEETARRLSGSSFTIPDLFFYLGDSFGNLGQGDAAEAAFKEEIRQSPANVRARSSLAALYRAEGRNAEAEQVIASLLGAVPTAEAYDSAIKLWTVFGERGRADAVRAEAARRFGARRGANRAGSPG